MPAVSPQIHTLELPVDETLVRIKSLDKSHSKIYMGRYCLLRRVRTFPLQDGRYQVHINIAYPLLQMDAFLTPLANDQTELSYISHISQAYWGLYYSPTAIILPILWGVSLYSGDGIYILGAIVGSVGLVGMALYQYFRIKGEPANLERDLWRVLHD